MQSTTTEWDERHSCRSLALPKHYWHARSSFTIYTYATLFREAIILQSIEYFDGSCILIIVWNCEREEMGAAIIVFSV